MAVSFIVLGLGLVLLTHAVVSLLQTILHRLLGHHYTGSRFFRVHTLSHHTLYSGDHLLTEKYSDDEQSLTLFFAVPAIALEFFAFMTLSRPLFVIQFATLLISFGLHAYLHVQYHLVHTWLASFGWFQRKRALHLVHHREPGCNFAVLGFLWDRLMGTYRQTGSVNCIE